MKPKTNEQLCVLAQRGDAQAQEQLVQNNLGYIQKVANELYQSVGLGNSELGIDHDDLIQEGSIGLLRAAIKRGWLPYGTGQSGRSAPRRGLHAALRADC